MLFFLVSILVALSFSKDFKNQLVSGSGVIGGNAPEGQGLRCSRWSPVLTVCLFLQMSFGLLRVFSIVIPFLYVGTLISKNFAALLEEHDIFVPEDDDDDD